MSEARTVELKKDVIIKEEDISDLLSTALYDAIYYWCPKVRPANMVRKENDNRCYEDKLAEHLFNGGEIIFYEDEDESGVEKDFVAHNMKLDDFIKGIGKYLSERGTGSLIETKEGTKIDWGQIDSIEADCIIQYMCFDELVYG